MKGVDTMAFYRICPDCRADPECNGQQPGADQLARNGQNGIAERYRKGIDSH